MHFLYNPRKAAQAAAFLVRLNGGQMDMVSLTKILYLADRKCLVQRGRPITGDRMVSMPHGPVLSRIYDQIKMGRPEGEDQTWCEYLSERQGNVLSLKQADPSTDELSEYERAVLVEEHEQYRHFSFEQIKKLTHGLPEYRDPDGSSLPIDPAVILREAGWSEEDIQDARQSAIKELFLHDAACV
jgi:uncharacterized phage-associated protein